MDHSTLIYVMDPRGKFVTTFPDDTDPAAMTEALRGLWSKTPPKPAKTNPERIVRETRKIGRE